MISLRMFLLEDSQLLLHVLVVSTWSTLYFGSDLLTGLSSFLGSARYLASPAFHFLDCLK